MGTMPFSIGDFLFTRNLDSVYKCDITFEQCHN